MEKITQQFSDIVEHEKEKELIPFLKALTPEEKKQLVSTIKKLSRDLDQTEQIKPNTWSARGTPKQRELCMIASFVCYNRTDFEKQFFAVSIVREATLDTILPWYSPDWLGDFLNGLAPAEYAHRYLHYDLLIKYMEKGIFQPSKELIVRVLTQYIFEEGKKAGEKDAFKPEKLLVHPITLKEHIWYLFELPSELQQSNRFRHFEDEKTKEGANWQLVFEKLSRRGKIDRKRLLRESLLAANRNFNKILSGWFCDLFVLLQPAVNELIELQPVLFSLLNAPHSKPVNTSLDSIKRIVDHKNFDGGGFIDHAPVLFSSTTKSVVTSAMQLVENIAKNYADHRPAVCRSLIRVFMQPDNGLQTKAAKIIVSFQKGPDPSLAGELSAYDATLMNSAREILDELVHAKDNKPVSAVEIPVPTRQDELTPIPSIESIDDLIFLASQATDNNQSWHIDVLPAAILKFQKEITGENIAKLEPALQRAIKLIDTGFKANQGKLDHFISTYIVDISITLVNKYPEHSKPLRDQLGKFAQKREFSLDDWLKLEEGESNLAGLTDDHGDPFYFIHHYLLLVGLYMFRQEMPIPLLSTPTHEPGWIDAEVLVQRLAWYQQHNAETNGIDLQVALMRCKLQNTGNALAQAKKLLKGESLGLSQFLFGEHKEPQGPFDTPAAWFTASMCLKEKKKYKALEKFGFYKIPFEYYTGQQDWESVEEEYETEEYDQSQRKYIKVPARRKVLNILYPKGHEKREIRLDKMFEELVKNDPSNYEAGLLLRYMRIETSMWGDLIYKDMRRAFLLTPNNIELLLPGVLEKCLNYPTFWQETNKRSVTAIIQVLHELWVGGGNMAHVFIGTCMLSSDKTIANIAGEVWLKGVSASTINNAELGKAMGLHLRIEFAPIKRFTDLATQYLYRVSDVHNKALQTLIEYILEELPDNPVKNLKKILEIHTELLSVNKAAVTDAGLANKLKLWKKSK